MKGNVNFDDIIENAFIETYFQPVVDLSNGNVIGYEALTRGPRGSSMYLPNVLISEAKSRNRMKELDYLMRKTALVNAEKRGLHKMLFINIDPVAIYDVDYANCVVMRSAEYGIPPRNVTVEFSESSAVCSFEKFQTIISGYKNAGFSIAFDDINCAFTDINKVSATNPNYIKVGGGLVRGIKTDIDKRMELEPVITIANMINAKVIAVGVEDQGDLEVLYSMGVYAAQGNLIGIPQKEFKGISDRAKGIITLMNA